MTTVRQLKAYLETLNPETKVEVVEVYSGSWCQESRNAALDLGEYSDNCNVYGDTLYLGKD